MRMTRRSFVKHATLGSLGVATLRPRRAAAQEKLTLKYLSVARGEPRRQAILQVVERFEKAHPTIKVDLSEVPFDQYFQKVSVALAAGSGIDAFDVDSPLVAHYGHQDVLLPLDEYVNRKDWEDFLEQDRQIATYNGKIHTLPWSSSSQAVFYNVDMLKEAGITPPSTPDRRWTWAQLLEAAKKLTRKAPDGTTQVYGFVVEQVDRPYQILPLLQSNGAQVIGPDGSKTAGFLNSPEAVEALQFRSCGLGSAPLEYLRSRYPDSRAWLDGAGPWRGPRYPPWAASCRGSGVPRTRRAGRRDRRPGPAA